MLSVCVLTTGWRHAKFRALMDVLLPQAEQLNAEVIGLYNHGEHRVPVMRQRLLESASREYVAFVDDDDMVSDDYIYEIYKVFSDTEPASVGFQVQLGHRQQLSVCSWVEARRAGFTGCDHVPACEGTIRGVRDGIWHEPWGIMTPTRTKLARMCRFDTYAGRVGEDGWFRNQILPLLQHEVYIPRVLYHYQWDELDSSQTGWARRNRDRPPRPEISSRAFRWHVWSAP